MVIAQLQSFLCKMSYLDVLGLRESLLLLRGDHTYRRTTTTCLVVSSGFQWVRSLGRNSEGFDVILFLIAKDCCPALYVYMYICHLLIKSNVRLLKCFSRWLDLQDVYLARHIVLSTVGQSQWLNITDATILELWSRRRLQNCCATSSLALPEQLKRRQIRNHQWFCVAEYACLMFVSSGSELLSFRISNAGYTLVQLIWYKSFVQFSFILTFVFDCLTRIQGRCGGGLGDVT